MVDSPEPVILCGPTSFGSISEMFFEGKQEGLLPTELLLNLTVLTTPHQETKKETKKIKAITHRLLSITESVVCKHFLPSE